MKRTIRFLSVLSLSTILCFGAVPAFATPVFAEGLSCTVVTNDDGSYNYTVCVEDGQISSSEAVDKAANETYQAWLQENTQTPTPVRTCQDDGYPEGYYWSEEAQACVTDYVEPTPVPSVVPTSTPVVTSVPTVEPTVEPSADDIANAEQVLADALKQIAKGSLGFFESVGSQSAIDVLNASYTKGKDAEGNIINVMDYTSIGDDNDATTLDNMKIAIEMIIRGNDLRVQDSNTEGLNRLTISDMLMAMAQIKTNASQFTGYHTKAEYGLSENLAYGYSDDDPYEGWYYEEKNNYETKNGDQTGHYILLTSNIMVTTGGGYNSDITSDGEYEGTHTQQFASKYLDCGETYSDQEYYDRFMSYYNQVYANVENAKRNLNRVQQSINVRK